jgi:hypothetical protein
LPKPPKFIAQDSASPEVAGIWDIGGTWLGRVRLAAGGAYLLLFAGVLFFLVGGGVLQALARGWRGGLDFVTLPLVLALWGLMIATGYYTASFGYRSLALSFWEDAWVQVGEQELKVMAIQEPPIPFEEIADCTVCTGAFPELVLTVPNLPALRAAHWPNLRWYERVAYLGGELERRRDRQDQLRVQMSLLATGHQELLDEILRRARS